MSNSQSRPVKYIFVTGGVVSSLGKGLAAYTTLTIFSVIAIGPFLYLLSPSFRRSFELFSYPPKWIPHSLYTGNFATVLHGTSYLRWALNTLIFATSVTVLTLIIDTLAGYAFARLRFPGRGALFALVLTTLMIPTAAKNTAKTASL